MTRRRGAAILMMIVGLAGTAMLSQCTSVGRGGDYITLSAETAAIVGEHALETNTQYVTLCASKMIPPDRCDRWSRWFTAFQGRYHLAHELFETATAAGDIVSARDAADRIQALSSQLVLYELYGVK